MPRFVILLHEMPPGSPRATHWDFMLEPEDTATSEHSLSTWALDREPQRDAAIRATLLPDHRAAYLDYEGEVSGNRGHVTRWDAGEYSFADASTDQQIALELRGIKLRGTVTLTLTADGAWKFSWFS